MVLMKVRDFFSEFDSLGAGDAGGDDDVREAVQERDDIKC